MKKLIITEKELVATEFAKILKCKRKEGYYEGEEYCIAWLYGHMLRLYEPHEYNLEWKEWKIEHLPIVPSEYQKKIIDKSYIKRDYFLIKGLVEREDIECIINGGDCGVEGEGIQVELYEKLKVKKPIYRLWYDDFTEKKILKALCDMKESNYYKGYYEAFLLRSRLDFVIGMNYSRIYTLKSHSKQALSVGRVQTPLLKLIVERDKEIKNFKSTKFYTIESDFGLYRGKYCENDKDVKFDDLDTAKEIQRKILNKTGKVVKVLKEEKEVQAPKLMTLADLKISLTEKTDLSTKDIEVALQELYQKKKIMSYPRTESQCVTSEIAEEFKELLSILSFGEFKGKIDGISDERIESVKKNTRYVDNKKVTDHYALIPTLNHNISSIYSELNKNEKIVFDEIVNRLIAIFYKPYKYEKTEINTDVEGFLFKTNSKKEIDPGWKLVYEESSCNEEDEEELVIEINQGDNYKAEDILIREGKTKSPGHFTVSSLISTMKRLKLGTVATHETIINTLILRKYIDIKGKKVFSTELGEYLINAIKVDNIVDYKYTAYLEEKLSDIIKGKGDFDDIYTNYINEVNKNIQIIKMEEIKKVELKEKGLGKCPICNDGEVVERKEFYGCNKYKDGCKFSLPKNLKGAEVRNKDIEKLLSKGATDKLKGDEFDFYIVLDDNGKLKLKSQLSLGKCPICNDGEIVERKEFYGCNKYKDGCKFSLPKNLKGAEVRNKDIEKLLSKGATDKLKGDEFDFYIVLDDNGKLKLKSQLSLGKCPICNDGEIVERKEFYGCNKYKDGCKFSLPKNLKGAEIRSKDVEKLLLKGVTGTLKGEKEFKIKLEDKKIKIILKK